MHPDELLLRRAAVFGGALVYWAGVLIQARRVRRQIGHSPNVRPRGRKETLLWAGWILVITGWMVQPFLVGPAVSWAGLKWISCFLSRPGLLLGLVFTLAGYAGTLWCYAAMGATWRMGIDRREKTALVTEGPYRRVRHPIYLYQVVMLAGVVLLLPTPLSLALWLGHLGCVLAKIADEEAYLLAVQGEAYRAYRARSGRLLPRLRKSYRAPEEQ